MQNLELRMTRFNQKQETVQKITKFAQNHNANPEEVNPYLESLGSSPIDQKARIAQLISRPNIELNSLRNIIPSLDAICQNADEESLQAVEIAIKYEGYIRKEQEMVEKMNRLETVRINPEYDYQSIIALSNEAKTKLSKIKPMTIGQASRISGVSPADISVLLVHLGR